MKKTPLYQKHIDLGAKMSPFAGFEMPVVYSSINEEHRAVREKAGMFDVSHMGEFLVTGKEATELVQHLCSNDARKLYPGRVQYAYFPNEKGGIVDDLLIYRLFAEEPSYMLVVNGANVEKDWDWVNKHHKFDAKLENISDQTGLIALQGPAAEEILSGLTDIDLKDFPFYHSKKGNVAGIENTLVSTTGYTGSGGFEIYTGSDQIPVIWDALMNAGPEKGLQPAGLGARDTLRLEMGYCLYGNDIDDHTSPIEAGLGWVTKLSKGDFIGSDQIKKVKEEGPRQKLVAFTVDARRVPRKDYPILNAEGDEIGRVTSGTQSPSLGHPIGMGYVTIPYSKPGTKIFVKVGKKQLEAEVGKLPFYRNP
ncbi:MAG: glycine cleavage system aminomethyltransferase GcvT [Saprospirales bacterium]|nr:MAG: glycine cleavage system aminomethyltransferase GcvT [Saprospirales bacterium]